MRQWTTPMLDHAVMDVHPVDVAENGPDQRHFHVLHHNNFDLLRYGPLNDHTFNVLYQGHIIETTGITNAWRRFAKGAQVEIFLFGVGMLNARIWQARHRPRAARGRARVGQQGLCGEAKVSRPSGSGIPKVGEELHSALLRRRASGDGDA